MPWQRRTPSWEAAYNTACAYAALNRDDRVVISLQRALSNRDCELQQPWNWISQDPDFSCLKSSSEKFNGFLCSLERSDYPEAVGRPVDADGMGNGAGCEVSSSSPEAVPAGSTLNKAGV